jgi:hypothetical protein
MAKISIKKYTDPNINNVSLLLPFNSNFNDSSKNNLSVTAYGNAQISSTQSKFGASSVHFNGNGDYLEVSDNNLFNFGNGDFSIEFWIYFSDNPSPIGNLGTLVTTAYPNDLQGIYIGIAGNGRIQWLVGNGSYWLFGRDVALPLTQNQWYHIAYVRNGSNLLLFLNGTEMDSYNIGSLTLTNSNNKIHVGGRPLYNQYYNGYIDDLRVTKGTARYTSNFVPRSILPNNDKLNIKKIIEGSQVSSLSGLSLWLKADAGVTMGGGNVNTWEDQSSNGNNATGPATKKPTFVSNGINGKPAMSFNGSTQLFTINDSNSLDITNCSFYIVLKRNGNGTGNLEPVFMKNPSVLNTSPAYTQYAKVYGGNTKFIVNAPDNIGNVRNVDTQIDLGDGAARIMSFIYDGTIGDCYSNGIKTKSSNSNNGDGGAGNILSSTGTLQIGGNGAEYFNGYISELIIFNRALNTTEHLSVTNYLNDKYALYTSASIIRNGKLRIKTPPPFPTNGLLAFWRLNNPDGLSTISSDFGSYTLNSYGYTSVPGKINNAFNFSSSSEGMWTNEQIWNLLDNPTSFSVSFWVKITDNSSAYTLMGSAFGSIGFHFDYITEGFYDGTNYGITMNMSTIGGNYNWQRTFAKELASTDTWYHVVGTYNYPSTTMKLYINGDLKDTNTNAIIGENSQPPWHGFALNGSVSDGGKEYGSSGSYDALGFWNRDLTILEIAQLYNSGNGSEY